MVGAVLQPLCDGSCDSEHPGHVLTFTRFKLATAAKDAREDAIVTAVAVDGLIELRRWTDDKLLRLWHHNVMVGRLVVGEPVTCNMRFWLLTSDQLRLSVQQVAS